MHARDFWFFDFLAFCGHFYLKFLAKIQKTAKISTKNGHKMPKNRKIKNPLHANLDFSCKMILTKFGVKWSIWRATVANTSSNLGPKLGSFPIENVENAQKRPIFGDSYLDNRWELREKWTHFRKPMSRATTYIKIEEKNFLTLGPPPLSP